MTRRIFINITGDSEQLIATLERYQTWPAWRRWLWRKGIGR